MPGAVYVNGRITPEDQAVVRCSITASCTARACTKSVAPTTGRPFLLDRHLARLRKSASSSALDVPFGDGEFAARIDDTMKAAWLSPGRPGGPDAYIRILLTRGIGELTYDPAATPAPTLVIIARAAQSARSEDLRATASRVSHRRRFSATHPRRSTRSSSRTTCSTTRWRCRKRCAPAASRR